MEPDFKSFCAQHQAQLIHTPQQQPKLSLGMTANDCVDNAADYSALYPDWQFCAGWFWDEEHKRLLAHAWNRKNNKHRDVTPFKGQAPSIYIFSEAWSEQIWQSVTEFRAGDTSKLGMIHPGYTWQSNEWLEDKVKTAQEQMAEFFSGIINKAKERA